ncbi:hypothetical protein F5888DRAFT_871864 [Russula emetica]|nr:hypothetical protein F5888DRAFT_871864 [Russula emetica]
MSAEAVCQTLHNANISPRWMLEELVRSRCQFQFRYEAFAKRKVPTTIVQDQPPSPPQGVDALNAQDALQPITDELFKNPLWWILEMIPTSYTFQNTQGKWVTSFGQLDSISVVRTTPFIIYSIQASRHRWTIRVLGVNQERGMSMVQKNMYPKPFVSNLYSICA